MYTTLEIVGLVGGILTMASYSFFGRDNWAPRGADRRGWKPWLRYVLLFFLVVVAVSVFRVVTA